MIREKEKKRIINIIGHKYTAKVSKVLKESNEFNNKGDEYSTSQITNVMNGTQNETIEKAIYEVVINEKAEALKRKKALKAS